MPTIQEAKQQVEQAKQSAQEQRQKVAEAREKAKRDREALLKSEKKLPKKTQSRLRQGLYTGLEGRKRRRAVSKAKEELEGRKKLVGQFEEGLKEYETKELESFESQIKSQEEKIKSVEQDKAHRELAWKIASDQVSGGLMSRLPEEYQKLARKWSQELDESAATQYNLLSKKYTQPKEVPEVNLSNVDLKDTGFSRNLWVSTKEGEFGVPLKTFEERSAETGGFVSVSDPSVPSNFESPSIIKAPTRLPPIKVSSLGSTRDLGRTDILKDLKPLRDIKTDTSSFKIGTDVSGTPFLTTGSPIRRTKLTSLKSRGYQPYPKPKVSFSKPKKPLKTKSLSPSKKTKGYKDLFFGKKKKKGKKKSIWEL